MEQKVLCELCRKPMREIGPFASDMPEGQPAKKWDGKRKFQCLNESCDRYQEIIEIDISNLESYLARVQKLCQCGHTREMHDHRFSQLEEGKSIMSGKKDIKCKVNDCNCTRYS